MSFMLAFLLIALSLHVSPTDDAHIRSVLHDFVDGADARNEAQLRRALHPEARQYVQMPDGLVSIGTDAFLAMIKAEQIGGEDRTLAIHDVRIRGNTAFADISITGGTFAFSDYVSLMKVDGHWQIMSVVISLTDA